MRLHIGLPYGHPMTDTITSDPALLPDAAPPAAAPTIPGHVPGANPNADTVAAIYGAFGRGDVPFILEQLAEDVAWEAWASNSSVDAGVPWMRPRTGRAGVAEFFGAVAAMEIVDVQVLHLLDGGDKVAVEFVIEANLPDLGTQYRDEELHLWTFGPDGRVTAMRHYTDTAKHINAFAGAAGVDRVGA